MMTPSDVRVQIEKHDKVFRLNDLLTARYHLAAETTAPIRAIETSVLWYTEGKGNEDFGLQHFERHEAESGKSLSVETGQPISVRLPGFPLSYDGVLVKIRWCVRVRVFFDGYEMVGERIFQLGEVKKTVEVNSE